MENQQKILYIVVPCYNEEAALPETNRVLTTLMDQLVSCGKVSSASRVCYVDDGSKDATWQMISGYCDSFDNVSGIKLSRNRGHQNALLAGLMTVRHHCDMAVSLDADLQDDPGVIPDFIDKFYEGCDVVYGVRCDRTSDKAFKRSSAEAYYRFLSLLGVEVVFNHADYRLLSRRALDAMSEFGEANLFLRGIVPQLGFKTAQVEYARNPRVAGESKYSLGKMLSLAADGVTSFSIRPLRLISAFSCLLTALVAVLWILNLILGITFAAALMLSVWSCCCLILLAISLLGEYVGKSYLEVKGRPRYFVSDFINN